MVSLEINVNALGGAQASGLALLLSALTSRGATGVGATAGGATTGGETAAPPSAGGAEGQPPG